MSDSGVSPTAGFLLEAEHIARSFGRRRVLTDVSLQMNPGEIVGITGENGSGKSTLLNILVGRLRPERGRIRLKGRFGFCPQDPLVFDTLRVAENFRYFATAYGLNPACWPATGRSLAERLRFEPYLNTLVAQLSGGTRQKLNLALAFLHSPDLLILDEPYSGFDWETYLRFWEFARELRAQGRGLLIVSHFVYDRSQFDKVYQLVQGTLQCA